MLCSQCREKIKAGAVANIYMRVAKFLLDVEGQFPLLQKARLENVVEEGGFLVLVVGRGDRNKLTSYGGKLTRAMGDEFRKRVLVLEEGVSDRGFLEDLFSNQQIITINIIWLPDGSTETRVVLRGKRSRRLSKRRINALQEVARRVRGMSLRVEYA
jgi:transcription antitermination factor NusA-like protein